MKNKRIMILSIAIAILCAFSTVFVGCNNDGGDLDEETEYAIQYADDEGLHTITVKDGDLYSMQSIPTRVGYNFKGLFDAEEGGVQYVSAQGSSLSAFTDKKNLVLYPQFQAKEYTLILDFCGAEVLGSRSMKVTYGSELPMLQTNLTLENR
ncbi:MAG: hypothetical protein E7362_00130 [Clostridiales bacterium]|nr:hypothetical protein [Clostridiales bacterium]